ncbi:MAG: SDR family NAD(P)-dependent oxidoreductase [Gammaproteobacteria bacterium]|nr:SDR family NAD(P)-dependent oxidoreductase [Gammaproteobacteria bacterium]
MPIVHRIAVLTLLLGACGLAAAETVLVTGSNRGIGLEIARQYAARGWLTIATIRRAADDPEAAELRAIAAQHPNLRIEQMDVTDLNQIRRIADKYRDTPVDVVINNASSNQPTMAADMAKVGVGIAELDFDDTLWTYQVNAFGAMRVAQAFLPHLERSKHKKLVTITSMAGSFARAMGGGAFNYASSKAAVNKFMEVLAVSVKEKGVIVNLLEPSYLVATKPDMKDMPNTVPVAIEVANLLKDIDAMTLDRTGKIISIPTGEVLPF